MTALLAMISRIVAVFLLVRLLLNLFRPQRKKGTTVGDSSASKTTRFNAEGKDIADGAFKEVK